MRPSWWQSLSVVPVTVRFSGSGDRLFQWFWWQSVSVGLVTVSFSGSGDSLFQWFWWQSVSMGLVTQSACFSGSGDSLFQVVLVTVCFSGYGDSLFQWVWWQSVSSGSGDSLFQWLWWQSVSVGLVTVCFSGSGTVWFSVGIMSLKRMSWHLLIWEVLRRHHEFEENEMACDMGGHSSVFVFVSAWWSAIWSVVIYIYIYNIICINIVCFDVSCFSLGLTWERALWDPTFVIIIVCEYLAVGRVLMPWYLGGRLTHLAPDQPLPFRYEILCKGK